MQYPPAACTPLEHCICVLSHRNHKLPLALYEFDMTAQHKVVHECGEIKERGHVVFNSASYSIPPYSENTK